MKANGIHILTNQTFRREVLCNKQPVLVEFTTEWCGTSYMIAPILKDMVIKFDGDIKFCRIDIEDYDELAKQYGVLKIPTILLFRNGTVVDCLVGAVSREILNERLTRLIL